MRNDPVTASEAAQLGDLMGRVARTLAEINVPVVQRGSMAKVDYDGRSGKPKLVILPMLVEGSSRALYNAVCGFLDHEVAHLLFTDSNVLVKELNKKPFAGNKIAAALQNILEDCWIEKAMAKRFEGSKRNIAKVREFIINHSIEPVFQLVLEEGDDSGRLASVLLAAACRAVYGHPEFVAFMSDKWSHMGALGPILLKHSDAIKQMSSTKEVIGVARAIIEECASHNEGSGESDQKDDSKKDDSKKDDSKKEKGNPDPDQQSETDDGEGESDAPEQDESEEQEDTDNRGNDSEGADEDDEDEADSDEGDDTEGENAGDDDSEADDVEGAEDDDVEGDDDSEADDAEDSDQGDDSEGDDSEGDDSEGDDSEGDDSEGDDSEGDDSEGDSSDGLEADDDAEDSDQGDDSDASNGGDIEEDDQGEVGEIEEGDAGEDDNSHGASNTPIILNEEDVKDLDDALSEVIGRMVESDIAEVTTYRPYSREWDYVGPIGIEHIRRAYPDPGVVDGMIELGKTNIRDAVEKQAGVIQSEISRAFQAKTLSRWEYGQKRGRINGAALARLSTGDNRVFRSKLDQKGDSIAVSLLVDCSGSMWGAKITNACRAAYMLGSVLDRLNLKCEIAGFSTMGRLGCMQLPLGDKTWKNYERTIQGDPSAREYDRLLPITHFIWKGFSDRFTEDRKRALSCMPQMSGDMQGNNDGEAVQIAGLRLLAQPVNRRVLIVFSDGNPAGGGRANAEYGHLRAQIASLTKQGVELFGFGLEDPSVKLFYKNHEVLTSTSELTNKILSMTRQLII